MATAPRSTFRAMATALFGSRVPRVVITLIVVVVLMESAYLAANYLLTPWARARGGQPPLLGYWQGQMTIAPGDTREVALYLRRFQTTSEFLLRGSDRARGVGRTPDVRVAVKMCGAKGTTRYHGNGNVANRDGTRFTFGLTPERDALGTHPSDIEGVWDGENRIELKLRLYTQGADAARGEASRTARPGGGDDPGVIRVEMRRIAEPAYDAAC